ncbi:MAG: ATP-binding protein [Betaproteobacteria bacterium]
MARVPARSGVVLALAVVALAQVFTLLQGVRSARRLQARVGAQAEQRLAAVRPRLDQALARGGRASWEEGAALAIGLGVASEVEVLDAAGRTLFARPGKAPVVHVINPEQRQLVSAGRTVTVLLMDGGVARTLSYLPLPAEPGLVLRLAASAGDLEDDVRERHQVFLAHVVSLVVLAAALLLVLRRREDAPAAATTAALGVYEQAMERLRDHGEQVEARHVEERRRDEQERRRMAEVMREREAMARAGELTTGIVHEVRNGLGTILGYARMIERADSAQDPKAAAQAIREECETLETVVRRFADFVRLDELRLGPVDLARLLARVAGRERRGHEAVDVQLTGLDAPVEARADEELLERAVENVVRNAIAAAAAGGGHVTIGVRTAERLVEVTIEDDGPGLAPDHPGEIRPFYTTRAGGLGLGLPLARKIMLLHGGDLELRRRPQGGALARLALPRTERS